MSELVDLLNTVDKQHEDIDVLTNKVSDLIKENKILNEKITACRSEISAFREDVFKIIENMGFDASRLIRSASCRVKT